MTRRERERRETFADQLGTWLALATLRQIGRLDIVNLWFDIDAWDRYE